MTYYGLDDCDHIWRHRKGGWEEQCIPAICIKCGAYGCICEIKGEKPSKEVFFGGGQERDTNLSWENPYAERRLERLMLNVE